MASNRDRVAVLMSVVSLLVGGLMLSVWAAETKAVQELLDVLRGKGATARTLLDHKQEIQELSDEEFLTFCNELPEALFGDKWEQDGVGMIACHFALELRGLGAGKYLGEISKKDNHPAFREALIHAYRSDLFGLQSKADHRMRERAIQEIMPILQDREAKRELRYFTFGEGDSLTSVHVVRTLKTHENLRRRIEKEEGIDKLQADPRLMQRIRKQLEKECSGEELERCLKITQEAQVRTARGKAFENVDLGKYDLPEDVRRAFDLKKEYLHAVFEIASHPDEDRRLLQMASKKLIEVASDKKHFLKPEAEKVLVEINLKISQYPEEVQRVIRPIHKSPEGSVDSPRAPAQEHKPGSQ